MGEGGIDSPNACSIRQSLSEHGLGDVIVGLLQTQMTLPRVQHQAAGIVARLAYDDDEVHFERLSLIDIEVFKRIHPLCFPFLSMSIVSLHYFPLSSLLIAIPVLDKFHD